METTQRRGRSIEDVSDEENEQQVAGNIELVLE